MNMNTKLRPLEALCVAGAVEDGLDRLKVLQSLTPNVITQRDELSNILGDKVAQLIAEQKRCEAKYERLVKKRSELKSLSNKTKYKNNQAKIQQQAQELKKLTNELCKSLRESPNVSDNLMKIQNHRSNLTILFESFHSELLKSYSFNGLASWTQEQTTKFQQMMKAIENDKQAREDIRKKQESIQNISREMQTKVDELENQIRIEKETLQILQAKNEQEKAKRDDEKNARLTAIQEMNRLIENKLTQQVLASKRQLENEKNVHSVAQAYFDKRREKITRELSEWTIKYDHETKEAAQTLQDLTDRIERATTGFIELKPVKEHGAEQLILEIERDRLRTAHTEIRMQQDAFMGKLKVLYMLHVARRGRLPRKKGKKKKKKN